MARPWCTCRLGRRRATFARLAVVTASTTAAGCIWRGTAKTPPGLDTKDLTLAMLLRRDFGVGAKRLLKPLSADPTLARLARGARATEERRGVSRMSGAKL